MSESIFAIKDITDEFLINFLLDRSEDFIMKEYDRHTQQVFTYVPQNFTAEQWQNLEKDIMVINKKLTVGVIIKKNKNKLKTPQYYDFGSL